MTRIHYRIWGTAARKLGLSDGYAMLRPYDITQSAAVVRSLERRTGLVCCGGPRSEGTALVRGEPHEQHYACTLGRPCRGGGYTPIAEVWYAVSCA